MIWVIVGGRGMFCLHVSGLKNKASKKPVELDGK
jgi:hypothetical protein